ncbi:hypothetical protein GGE24_003264 [Bradyrhizobium centrosematis]|nr:hypothetical protein [Bradyrhizobium centrosematis]MCS3773952.1 hypothetical protein [Bradyrhizobium centrosematis]
MPEDAKEATGHGIRAKRSKFGAISFEAHAAGGIPCISPVSVLEPSLQLSLEPKPT